MRNRLAIRLDDLRAEHEKGKRTLEDLEAQAANVRATMLRISGAIQVLEEELAHAEEGEPDAPGINGGKNGSVMLKTSL